LLRLLSCQVRQVLGSFDEVLLAMRLDHTLLPLRDYHKAKRLMWDPQDLDFSQDQRDWAAMSEREQDLIRRAIALFIGGEAAVTDDLAPLLIALKREGGHLEEEMFLTTQLFEEAKHVEFFDAVIGKVLGETPEPSQIAGDNYRQLFAELSAALDALLSDHSRQAQARAVASYHMTIEGVLAETGYYGIFKALRTKGLMPGLTQGLEYVQRDEARHIAFGLHLLSRLTAEAPEVRAVVDAQLNKLLPLAQGVFMELLSAYLPNIPFDLDLNDIVGYAGRQYMARLSVLERAR
jgi:ribonucleoside-diphosphate reductase beta chain